MSQLNVNTTPLFQTSLRMWQASWKANHGGTPDAAEPIPEARRGQRAVRLNRRPRRRKNAEC